MAAFCAKVVVAFILFSILKSYGYPNDIYKAKVQNSINRQCAQWFSDANMQPVSLDIKRNRSLSLMTIGLLTPENVQDYLDPELQEVYNFSRNGHLSFNAKDNIQFIGIKCLSAYPIILKHLEHAQKQDNILEVINPAPEVLRVDSSLQIGFQDTMVPPINISEGPAVMSAICTQDNMNGTLPEYISKLGFIVQRDEHSSQIRLSITNAIAVSHGFFLQIDAPSGTLKVCLPMVPVLKKHRLSKPTRPPTTTTHDNSVYSASVYWRAIPVKFILTVVIIIGIGRVLLWIISPELKKAERVMARRQYRRSLDSEALRESLAALRSSSKVRVTYV